VRKSYIGEINLLILSLRLLPGSKELTSALTSEMENCGHLGFTLLRTKDDSHPEPSPKKALENFKKAIIACAALKQCLEKKDGEPKKAQVTEDDPDIITALQEPCTSTKQALDTKLAGYYSNAAFCLLQLNDIEQSKKCFEYSIELSQAHPEPYAGLGQCYWHMAQTASDNSKSDLVQQAILYTDYSIALSKNIINKLDPYTYYESLAYFYKFTNEPTKIIETLCRLVTYHNALVKDYTEYSDTINVNCAVAKLEEKIQTINLILPEGCGPITILDNNYAKLHQSPTNTR